MSTNYKSKHKFEAGLQTKVDVSNVHDTTPTEAQVVAAFGAAADAGAGFIGMINDANGGVNVYLCYSTGAKWVFLKGTVCV